MNVKNVDSQLKRLFQMIISIKTEEECERLFYDLCTMAELQAMGQRFQVAELLYQGKIYADIAKETGASTATISRVNRALNYGAGGYMSVLSGSEKEL